MKGRQNTLIELRGETPRATVAKELNITPQMLGMLERGQRNPSLDLAKRIANYYGVTLDSIFFSENGHKSFPKHNSA